MHYESQIVKVILSEDQAGIWGAESEVGVYSTLDIGAAGSLEVIVRTDFACLDRSNEENSDALANPQAAARLLIEAGILRGATPLSPQHESQKTRVLPEIATRLAEHLSAYAA